jgi:hypothetical protein
VLTGLPNGMTAAVSGVAAVAHFAGSAVATVASQKHSASASVIVVRKTDTGVLHLQWHLQSVHLRGSENWLGYEKR